jgi:hypothetical protein
MENQLSKMSVAELKARAYDVIGIFEAAREQLQLLNNEIGSRQQPQTKPAKEEQLELPLEKKEEFKDEPAA